MGPKTAKSIFLHALDAVAPSDWSRYVAEACGNDRDLRADVDRLLDAHQQDGDLADEARGMCDAALRTVDHGVSTLAGTTIGPYKLREQIGEGGMGVVYVAEQIEPINRKVALKVVKPGMATKEVVARFEAERQALAMMDHPNIAKVHDGGVTDTGHPYFVMELVQGLPITEYCDSHCLGTRARLELMKYVCRAVHHAHQKGIIHRDLKPSNVMVARIDGTPVPKVIDFGVAKAIGQRLTQGTVYTQFSQLVGTPLYMSPEQTELGVIDVDTRSDVYSLGVLLYELLTGSTPFDGDALRDAGFDEMRRIIREEEPPRPSVRITTLKAEALSTVSEKRQSQPRKLSDSLRGELDWLVMKALEKDRNRRYESASAFAADVERYLAGEALHASPPSVSYQLKKFFWRNKTLLLTATAVLSALLVGIAGTSWQAWHAVRERDAKQIALDEATNQKARAEQSAAQRKALVEFFVDDLLGAVSPEKALGSNVTVEEVVAEAERKIEHSFQDQPLLEAAIRRALGEIQLSLGNAREAERHLVLARDIQQRILGTDAETLETMSELVKAVRAQSRLTEAHQLCERTLAFRRRLLGPTHHTTLDEMTMLGVISDEQGNLDRAQESIEKALEMSRAAVGKDAPQTITAEAALGRVLLSRGKYDQGLRLLESSLESAKRKWGRDHPETMRHQRMLAELLCDPLDRHKDALRNYREIIDIQRRIYGPIHPETMHTLNGMVDVLLRQGQLKKAIDEYQDTYERLRSKLGDALSRTLAPTLKWAHLLARHGHADRAEKILAEALQMRRSSLGREHHDSLSALEALADFYEAQNRFDEALPLQQELVDITRRIHGPEHPRTISEVHDLGRVLGQQGDNQKALQEFERAYKLSSQQFGEGHVDTIASKLYVARTIRRLGQVDKAEDLYREIAETSRRVLGPDHITTRYALMDLGHCLQSQGKHDEAIELTQTQLQNHQRLFATVHPETLNAVQALAYVLLRAGKPEQAVVYFREASRMSAEIYGVDHSETQSMNRQVEKYLRLSSEAEGESRKLEEQPTDKLDNE